MAMFGVGLIIVGAIYLAKPGLFQRWFWKRTAISQRLLSPEQNRVYMRILGGLFILIGIAMIASDGW